MRHENMGISRLIRLWVYRGPGLPKGPTSEYIGIYIGIYNRNRPRGNRNRPLGIRHRPLGIRHRPRGIRHRPRGKNNPKFSLLWWYCLRRVVFSTNDNILKNNLKIHLTLVVLPPAGRFFEK